MSGPAQNSAGNAHLSTINNVLHYPHTTVFCELSVLPPRAFEVLPFFEDTADFVLHKENTFIIYRANVNTNESQK